MKRIFDNRFFRIAAVLAVLTVIAGGWVLYGLEKASDAGVKVTTTSPAEAQVIDQSKITQAAKRAMPSVVAIVSTKVVTAPEFPFPFGDDSPFRRFFGDRDGEREQRRRGLGSGVIIGEDGYIITNAHVVKEADEIEVQLSDDRTLTAEVKGYDEDSDVGLLKIDAEGLPTLPMADSDKAEVGDIVLAVGSPFGLGSTVTMGIVSATGRADLGITRFEDFIQTDAAINPGNSGGALINLDGEVIGINTAIVSRTGGYQGIGFAIPSNLASKIADELREHGEVVRGYLGVQISEVDSDLAKSLGLDRPRGVAITQVYPDTPAEKAGLNVEDVILAVDGKEVNSPGALQSLIGSVKPGTDVELKIVRNGKEITKSVTIVEGDIQTIAGGETGGPVGQGTEIVPGLYAHDLTPALRNRLDLPDVPGIIVVEIDEKKLDSQTPLRQGDLILQINGRAVNTVAEAKKTVEDSSNSAVRLLIKRGNMNILTVVKK
ncbi:MAG: DegQ family serine endoprotease [Armatimonadota bacterium]